MKINRNSFLLFFFNLFGFLFIISGSLFAQKAIDSTHYYYKVIVQSENPTEITSALTFYEQNYKQKIKKGDSIGAAYALEMLALGKYNFGSYNESEQKTILALQLVDTNTDSISINTKKRLYNRLGILYSKINAFQKGLDLYKKAAEYSYTAKDSFSIINNVANILRKQENYTQAVDTLQYANIIASKLNDPNKKAYALDNLGFAQSKLNHPKAFQNLQAALRLRQNIKDSIGLFSSYRHLSLYSNENNKKEQAKIYADKALLVSQAINDIHFKKEALKLITALDNNPNIKRYQFLTDSLHSAEQEKQNKYAAMRYDVEKERRLTQQVELEREKEKQLKLIYLGVGAIILLTSIFIYFILRSRHKKEKIRQLYNTETRISKKVHDEVANDVYHVMTKLQTFKSIQEDVLDDLEEIYIKTRDISKQNSGIDLTENFDETLDDLLLSYKNEETTIITKNSASVDWVPVSDIKKTTIYRVLQELMTNMKKHSNATVVVIAFQQKNKKITIDYNDNGDGCSLKKGNGLQNTENRIKTIGGTITFDSQVNNGFKSTIIL
ncbi:tetratricopeptide repeat-containing sensor histidine kinase [Marixanthomonas ophiurae]|uniref:histidine kinase n=1 Tax=Marixanthomonas ophiurae TaxID=387659 RepID=A0A3E1Q9N9_9FLAO|nr:tetratricopeptide repeat-containing sensor histidine kinase [Marixanthomonas ophiurae]RFN58843.1 ATP-binding protein [Marixanthomonas ophiurae]